MKSTEFKKYLEGLLSRTIIHFIYEYFNDRNIHAPTLEQICEIPSDDLEQSWLSVPSMKELMLFQQEYSKGQKGT